MERVQRLISALWFGSAVFLMLASSAAFRAAGSTTIAADVVGSMLTRWHYIALAAPLALFAFELRRLRRAILIILFVSIILAAVQALVDLRIRSIRYSTAVPVSQLSPDDPVRRTFGALHGASMALLLMQAIAAATVVAAKAKRHEMESATEAWVAEPVAKESEVVVTPSPMIEPDPIEQPRDPDGTSGGGP